MANVKITDLTAYTDAASTDVLPVVDVTNDVTKKISISNLLKAAPLGSAAAPGIAFDGDPNTGVYSPGADQVAISANGAERLRVTTTGLGIGTTPGTKLHVESNGAGGDVWIKNGVGQNALLEIAGNNNTLGSTSALYGQDSTNNVYAGWARGSHPVLFGSGNSEAFRVDTSRRLLVGTSSSTDTALLIVQGNTSGSTLAGVINIAVGTATPASGGALGFVRFSDSGNSEAATIAARRDGGTWSGSSKPSRLEFSTTADGASSPTERMRISNDGSIVFQKSGASLNNEGVQFEPTVGFAVTKASGTPLTLNRQTNDGNAIAFYRGTTSVLGSIVGSVSVTTTSTAYNTSSDYRLKENIEIVTNATGRLKSLKPCRFNFISDPDTVVDGFIAHEVQEVVPEAITGEKDAVDDEGNPIYQGIDQSKLVPLLTAALQEAIGRIESLEAEVAALKAQ